MTTRTLKTITFIYEPREDRITAAINAGREDAWSCWLTRRLTLALLNRAPDYLVNMSNLAQRAPVELRSEVAAFERDSAIAQTARAISQTPPEILRSSAASALLAERLTIAPQGVQFRLELWGQGSEGAIGVLTRAELQRIVQMLQEVATKADWIVVSGRSAATFPSTPEAKPVRH